MNRLYILGYSEAVLSLVLESLRATGETQALTIVKNMAVANVDPYLPAGMEVEMVEAGSWKPGKNARYLLGVATPSVKLKVFDFFLASHRISKEKYTYLVHPSSVIASSVKLTAGTYVEPGSVLSPFVNLGFGVTINRGVSIGHHTVLGDFSTINPGVHIAGNARIDGGAQVGIGAVVFNKVHIGANSVIGGGSVVTGNIPAGVMAWGNPCKVIKEIS